MKKMLITYNPIAGIPVGRHEINNLIVYSGDYGATKYIHNPYIGKKIYVSATEALNKIVAELKNEVAQIDVAYVYVGSAVIQEISVLMRDLLDKGEEVHMIACACNLSQKEKIRKELGIKRINCECGGNNVVRDLVAKLSS